MNDHRRKVEAAIRATVFYSPTEYSWFGRHSEQLSPTIKRALTSETARSYLLYTLQSQLYADFYCRGIAMPVRQGTGGHSVPASTLSFVRDLVDANSGSGYWDEGWDVSSVAGDEVVLHKEGLALRARPRDCLIPESRSIEPGVQLSLRFPKDSLSISPGFYMAHSDEAFAAGDSETLLRIYWNLTREGAVPFMGSATSMLNQAHLAFRLKVLNDPDQFDRCDAAVIYVRKRDFDAVFEIVGEIYPEVDPFLRPATPAFTKPIAPGVAVAEDPAQGESFGMHRCGLLADGMIRAHEQGREADHERLRTVEERFAKAGISLEKPFLSPGSHDDYRPLPRLPQMTVSLHIPQAVPHTGPSTKAFLRTADEIGLRLAQEAVWYQDRCNWLGTKPGTHRSSNGLPGMEYSALGPDLYAGTSGVALFLAELYAATGGTEARRTAQGAIRQALSKAEAIPPSSRLGLYTGWPGIAFAAVRVGTLLGDEELLEHAAQLLQRTVGTDYDKYEFDLISGRAGAIAALVVLHAILDDSSLLDYAVRLADDLVQTAEKTDGGYSWRTPAFPKQRNLTGFSHGTAGVGYALLELFHATGQPQHRRAAELAFQYERTWFDPESGNWPDFREEPGQRINARRPLSFATAWCHGAPGIALSRLRAYEITKDETVKDEAIIALQTTHQMLETSLHTGTGNFSLCHGLAGNAEVLLCGSQVLGPEGTRYSELARIVGERGIETYAKHEHRWPSGVGGGETPNLMLGLAGIGYFYLRLHNPETPAISILRRESFLNGS
jgi:hypothetical protein